MAISNSANNNTIITVKQGRQILLQLETSSELIVGQKWYILNLKWWREFVSKVEKSKDENEAIEMPPISNEDIVLEDDPDFPLKPNLQLQVHITVLPEQVFNLLKEAFGLAFEKRDTITREVVNGTLLNQSTFIEIYPLMIKIADYSNRDDIHTIFISQADSVEKIRKAIMDRLEINEEARRSARFLVEHDNGKYEALPDPISHTKLMSALLTAGVTVFVDSRGSANQLLEMDTSNNNGSSTRAGTTRYSAHTSPQSPTNYQPGVCGLQNLGNTCFMSSVLQCLSNVPEMTEYFVNNKYRNEINAQNPLGTQGRLVKAYAEMLQGMWSGQTSSVRPIKLKCVIGGFAPRFNSWAQQDSQEFAAFLMDGLHEDLNRVKKKPFVPEKEVDGEGNNAKAASDAWRAYKKRNHSIIVDLFHGQLRSAIFCSVCKKVSIKFDPFCFLSIPILDDTEVRAAMAKEEGGGGKERTQSSDSQSGEFGDLLAANGQVHSMENGFLGSGGGGDGEEDEEAKSSSSTQSSLIGYSYSMFSWFLYHLVSMFIIKPLKILPDMLHNFFSNPIPLELCLKIFFSIDPLCGDDMYSCERCKKLCNGFRHSSLTRLPKVLIIHLKRFRHESAAAYNTKLRTRIAFPLYDLDMADFVHPDVLHDGRGRKMPTRYNLCGLISHRGHNMEYGHYLAYCQNADDQHWYEFDDAQVTRVSPQEVAAQEAYVLFYKRNDDDLEEGQAEAEDSWDEDEAMQTADDEDERPKNDEPEKAEPIESEPAKIFTKRTGMTEEEIFLAMGVSFDQKPPAEPSEPSEEQQQVEQTSSDLVKDEQCKLAGRQPQEEPMEQEKEPIEDKPADQTERVEHEDSQSGGEKVPEEQRERGTKEAEERGGEEAEQLQPKAEAMVE